MNHSFYSADRSTHLKIAVVALVAGIVVSGLALSSRTTRKTRQREPAGFDFRQVVGLNRSCWLRRIVANFASRRGLIFMF